MGYRRYAAPLKRAERYLLALFLVALPFDLIRPTAVLLLLTIASWVFRKPIWKGLQQAARQPAFWLLAGLALIHLVAPLYGESLEALRRPLEKKTALLVLPLYFATNRLRARDQRFWVQAFVLGCLALVVVSFPVSHWMHSQHFPDIAAHRYLTGQSLLWFLNVHRVYASMAVLLGGILLVHHPALDRLKYWRYGLAFLFVAFTLLLSSKLFLLFMGGLAVLYMLRLPFPQKLLPLGLLLLAGVAVWSLPSTRNHMRMFTRDVSGIAPEKLSKGNGVATRLLIWQETWKLIQERPITGYGIKGSGKALHAAYAERGFKDGVRHKLNCHNQFLQSWLELGLPGLLWLLAVFGAGFYRAWQYKDWIFFIFLLLSMAGMTTENMLERQMGIFIFAFWLSFGWFGGLRPSLPVNTRAPDR